MANTRTARAPAAGEGAPGDGDAVPDFTQDEEITFRIGPHQFWARPDLSADALSHVQGLIDVFSAKENDGALSLSENMQITEKIFQILLKRESYQRLLAAMEFDPESDEDPIGIRALTKVVQWLMEQYGERPTEVSAPSSPTRGGPVSGTRSAASALPAASTSGP